MELFERTYRLTFTDELLGTMPGNKEIFADFVAKKAETLDEEIEDAKGVVFDAGMQEGDPPVQMDFMCFLPDSIMVKGFPENTLPLHITTKKLVGAEEFSHFCKTNEAYRARADANLSKIIEAAAHV